ncbi:ligase [Allonocardiopsis opalescens]|uniref:ligase n=1 Tax=Allonocardiopsis opalescens TaxID=1144618 RepID=UPI001FE524B9|nr:ligase [Allonocardiopsis opalescens]
MPPTARRAAAGPVGGPAGALPPGWPLIAMVGGYPLWWALGLGQFAFWLFAVPMAVELVRRPAIRVPPGFALWLLFLAWSLFGLALVHLTPPDTMPGSAGYLGFALRQVNYLVATVVCLYIGNLGRSRLPDATVARLLAWLCAVTVAGGLLGTFAPHFSYPSPLEALLPEGLAGDAYLRALLRPTAAQTMDFLGYDAPRASAPWEYTNTWAQNFSLLLAWLVAGWWCLGGTALRWAAGITAALALVPVVYSMNRGLWIALALAAAFAAHRLARAGRVRTLLATGCAAALLASAVALSPLLDVVQARLDNPHSDDGREAASAAAVRASFGSPVVGWGSTREMRGSGRSIAIGASRDCPQCGNMVIGNNGQLWLMLIANGWVGAALFLGYFGYTAWRYRADRSAVGSAALLGLLLPFWFMFVYTTMLAALIITMAGVAVLWRRERETARAGSPPVPRGAP